MCIRDRREFLRADTRFVAYGGARGGGKSWAVRQKALLMALHYDGIRLLLLRRSYPEPVSYTHLDVYKRQVDRGAGFHAG